MIVIVIAGIIAAGVSVFIRGPVEAWEAQHRRAELVDAAEMALRRMARDVRRAVPNSVRITGDDTLEMLNTLAGGRYRSSPGPGAASADKRLQFNQADTAFNIQGPFPTIASADNYRLVVYNLGIPGADAWTGDAVVTPPGTIINIEADDVPGEQAVTLAPGHQFALQSPYRRIFLVDTAVRYSCGDGEMRRHVGYLPPDSPPPGALVTENVGGCAFSYSPGTATRSGLVTARITLTDAGETITLLHQMHVDNAP
ncbi:pilus assembly protein MshO [Ectothiorhodospiraceae bacterium 2226]|nr:pilus assembly protein MshO [Ectothiorhodospiraceae bacterium 2226]